MNAETEQIKLSYEKLGMSVLDIAENRKLEPEAVKAALASCSAMFRKDCGETEGPTSGVKDDGLNFTDEQHRRVNEQIFQLAVGAESEVVRAKMSIYIRDDVKGRHDAVKSLAGATINVLTLNEMMQKEMRRANELIYGISASKAITEV